MHLTRLRYVSVLIISPQFSFIYYSNNFKEDLKDSEGTITAHQLRIVGGGHNDHTSVQ